MFRVLDGYWSGLICSEMVCDNNIGILDYMRFGIIIFDSLDKYWKLFILWIGMVIIIKFFIVFVDMLKGIWIDVIGCIEWRIDVLCVDMWNIWKGFI